MVHLFTQGTILFETCLYTYVPIQALILHFSSLLLQDEELYMYACVCRLFYY